MKIQTYELSHRGYTIQITAAHNPRFGTLYIPKIVNFDDNLTAVRAYSSEGQALQAAQTTIDWALS